MVGSAGTGDYLFTLPLGLSFDLTLKTQQLDTSNIQLSDAALTINCLPSSGKFNTDTTFTQAYALPYTSTKFRIFLPTINDSTPVYKCWGFGYFALNIATLLNMGGFLRFSFTAA